MTASCPRLLRRLLLTALLLSLAPLAARDFTALDAYLERARADWGVPGMAVAIVQGDSLVFARGYGVRRLGDSASVTEHTLFAVASNTKAFTATLLGLLVEEGKLSWDDRVADHIREFQMHDPMVSREMRVRDLLSHRSGLSTYGGDHIWIGNEANTRDEIVRRLRWLEPTAPFRYRYQYQNLMFLVAGELIPAIDGESWDAAIRRRLLDPLAMTASTISINALNEREDVAAPHERRDGKVVPVPYEPLHNIAPAAALNSSAVEMAQWMRLNLNNGIWNGDTLVHPNTIRELQSLHTPIPISRQREELLGTRFSGYGLGWRLYDYAGRKVVTHGGGMSGMISLQTLIPEEGLGVMVLTNFAPTSLTGAVTYRILDFMLDRPEQDWSARFQELEEQSQSRRETRKARLEAERIPDTRPSLPLEQYAGVYHDPFSGDAQVRLENGGLVFDYNPRHRGTLAHWHFDTFRVTWENPIFDMPGEAFLSFDLRGDLPEPPR